MTTNPPADAGMLRTLLEKATPGPWYYRPQEYDDWGFIRGGEPGEFGLPVVAVGREVQYSDIGHDEHRRAGTDPYGPNSELIAEAITALPALLDLIAAQASQIEALTTHRDEALDANGVLVTECAKLIDSAESRAAAAEAKAAKLAAELAAIKAHTWCWPEYDGESPFDYPLEWAEYDLDTKASPHIAKFEWAGRLPPTWAVFIWAGDDDGGEWNVVEYESEAAAKAALDQETRP